MFHLKVGLFTRERKAGDDFRLLAFLHDGSRVVASWDVPPAYDWVFPHSWGPRDHFVGGFDLPLPQEVPEGRYGIGFAITGRDGAVIEAAPIAEDDVAELLPAGAVVGGRGDVPALFARGEVRWDDALTIVTIDALAAVAKEARETAIRSAAEGDCEGAEQEWQRAQDHRPQNRDWVAEHVERVSNAMADCWADRAVRGGSAGGESIEAVVRARAWDPRNEAMLAAARPIADAHYAQGEAAREAGELDLAYSNYAAAVRAWPWHAWARRRAEDVRAARLELDVEAKATERREEVREREERRKRASAPDGADQEPTRGGDEEP
jgi:hypothetical protein